MALALQTLLWSITQAGSYSIQSTRNEQWKKINATNLVETN